MLGEAFYRQFRTDFDVKVTDIDLNAPWISFLDFRDHEKYREDVRSFQPDYLFHLGAHTNLEYCEENPEDTFLTNTTSVEYAVNISNELGIPLLYISTAGIFDGTKENYTESDQPNPAGNYARSKYLAERFVQDNKQDHLICRAGWMMGGGPGKDKKFVGRILDQIREGRRVLNVVNDRSGTPTYTMDFANNVKLLLATKRWGLYNMACSGDAYRTDVAREILKVLGKEQEIRLNEVSSDFFNKTYFAPRPESERLVNAKLDQMNMNQMRDWKTCLKEYLQSRYENYLETTSPVAVVQSAIS
jgi:dTDP-4-dehydrorhamnose reductase